MEDDGDIDYGYQINHATQQFDKEVLHIASKQRLTTCDLLKWSYNQKKQIMKSEVIVPATGGNPQQTPAPALNLMINLIRHESTALLSLLTMRNPDKEETDACMPKCLAMLTYLQHRMHQHTKSTTMEAVFEFYRGQMKFIESSVSHIMARKKMERNVTGEVELLREVTKVIDDFNIVIKTVDSCEGDACDQQNGTVEKPKPLMRPEMMVDLADTYNDEQPMMFDSYYDIMGVVKGTQSKDKIPGSTPVFKLMYVSAQEVTDRLLDKFGIRQPNQPPKVASMIDNMEFVKIAKEFWLEEKAFYEGKWEETRLTIPEDQEDPVKKELKKRQSDNSGKLTEKELLASIVLSEQDEEIHARFELLEYYRQWIEGCQATHDSVEAFWTGKPVPKKNKVPYIWMVLTLVFLAFTTILVGVVIWIVKFKPREVLSEDEIERIYNPLDDDVKLAEE